MTHRLRTTMACAAALLWSAAGSSSLAQVVVNEVHYRPAGTARLGFVELFNAGSTSVDLSGWSLASAVRFEFSKGTSIAPAEYLVVAADPSYLRERGPAIPQDVRVLGWEAGELRGGRVQLLDASGAVPAVVDDVAFTSEGVWELVNPRIDNGTERAWRPSAGPNGTPGAPNSTLGEPVVIQELPARGTAAAGAREISVTFSETMKSVRASDLTVNGTPAIRVSGSGSGPYIFSVRPLETGRVSVALRGDLIETVEHRAFPGDAWQYATPAASVMSMPDNANGGVGATVQVPISAAPGDGILGIDMTLQYNAAVVVAQDVTVSGIAATAGFGLVRNLNNPGSIIISTYATQNALVGSGEIASIQFQVVGAPGATSNLTFSSVSINEGGIPANPDPGLFTVTCAGSPNGTACNDGNSCTATDSCQAGACTGTPLVVPTEIGNVQFAADHASITWDSAAPAGPGTVHDVARGLVSQLPVGGGAAETCFAPGIAAATVSDSTTPPASNGFWYLVRGKNACGTGSYGFRGINGAPGAERMTSTCP